jgi:TPR repeat protein
MCFVGRLKNVRPDKFGQGYRADHPQAVAWFRKAAEQDNAGAQFFLGVMYENGQGTAQDYQQAVAWYRKAAEQGNAAAQSGLGRMYTNRLWKHKNIVEAHKWFNIAAAGGDAQSIELREITEKEMTPKQIDEAQRKASAWMAKHPAK